MIENWGRELHVSPPCQDNYLLHQLKLMARNKTQLAGNTPKSICVITLDCLTVTSRWSSEPCIYRTISREPANPILLVLIRTPSSRLWVKKHKQCCKQMGVSLTLCGFQYHKHYLYKDCRWLQHCVCRRLSCSSHIDLLHITSIETGLFLNQLNP